MQVSDFKVDFRLKKKLKGICMEFMECFNEDAKKKGHFVNIRGGDAKIATDTKSLDSRYAYYVSNHRYIPSVTGLETSVIDVLSVLR